MPSIINSSTSGGLITTGSTDGQLQLQTAGTTSLTIDSSQNVGLGVTPNAWNSDYRTMQFGATGLLYGRSGGEVALGTNWYRNAAGTFLYTTTNFASYYAQSSGVHYLFSAPSGTAGNTVTFTQVLSVNKGTTLVLENGTSSSGTGIAFPATQSASSNANTLDDYEEGTWTATLTCGTSGTITLDSSYNTGYYTKIGSRVFFNVLLVTSSVSSPVGNLIMNLPFATDTTRSDNNQSSLSIHASGLSATAITSIVGAIPYASGAQCYIRKFATGSVSNLAGDVPAGASFQISGQYLLS